jgi:cell volume regulation protein A
MLGLLVFPSRLPSLMIPGLLIAVLLVLVARPLAVFVSLAGARWLNRNDKLFLSFTGLRGAVPIILAIIPLTADIPQAETIFNVVFFAVLVSVLVQGTLLGKVASWLHVTAPGSTSEEHTQQNTIELIIDSASPARGKQLVDLKMPRWALLLLVTREGESFVPQGSTTLLPGDRVLLVTRKEDLADLAQQLTGTHPAEVT